MEIVEITDEMVDAYFKAQRELIQKSDELGRVNIGGHHRDLVRKACRDGLLAAFDVAPFNLNKTTS